MDDDLWARMLWSTVARPGDRVVGEAIAALGPSEALSVMWSMSQSGAPAGLAGSFDCDPGDLSGFLTRYPTPPNWRTGESLWKECQRHQLTLLTPGHPHWPTRLNDLGPYAPLVLYARGQLDAGVSEATMGVVGSREPSESGRRACQRIVSEAANVGYTLVSGGARGIDWAAHTQALSQGMPQIMVLATALNKLATWQKLAVDTLESTGLMVSETPPGFPISPVSFLHRNRVIAALSDRVIVVEAAERSGSLNTASHAKKLGRDLSAVIARPRDRRNAGCFRLVDEWGADVYRERAGAKATNANGEKSPH